MEEYRVIVEEINFRNEQNGFTVASVRPEGADRITAVGILPFLMPGERAVLTGEITEHREYGRQIRVTACTSLPPETMDDMERYLASGTIRGVGPATAKLICRHFGMEASDILATRPERLAEIPGIGPKRARMIGESYAQNIGSRRTVMFLQGLGVTPGLSGKILSRYGEMTETVVRTDPYRLADEVDGVGFLTADRIAQALGFRPDAPERLRAGISYVLTDAMNGSGHVYLPTEELISRGAAILRAPEEAVDHVIREQMTAGRLSGDTVREQPVIYLPGVRAAECEVADRLRRMIVHTGWAGTGKKGKRKSGGALPTSDAEKQILAYEEDADVTLAAEQRRAVMTAVRSGVCVITGGPGTGKTTSIRCLIRLLSREGSVELCAPTGRAAKRMSETAGMQARTIHRMLEYQGEEGTFKKCEEEPLNASSVIVDETSMVDLFLMRSLLRAIRPGTRLILVGDADQLPSVGAGNVLHDLIASGVIPVVRLTEVFRQAAQSDIILNAHRIDRGEYPVIRNKDTDFFLERRESAVEAAQSVVALVKQRLPGYLGVDPLREIQVMTPMKKGMLGVFELNRLLQRELNPPEKGKPEIRRGDTVFRLGDKVMQIRNDYELEWTKENTSGKGVFNGDIGFIRGVEQDPGALTVEFDDGRLAEYTQSELEELETAYCMSVHKSQGSEFAAVVLPLISGPPMLMTRNLLYTAVTRARRLAVIVGREACVRAMVDNDHVAERYSALDLRLKGRAEA